MPKSPGWKRPASAHRRLPVLRRPETRYKDLESINDSLSEELINRVEIILKYEGYVTRQEAEVARFKNLEDKRIPDSFDYTTVPSLRLEARQKLMNIRPATVGQASRISGVSPADIGILMVWLKRSATEAAGAES